jgi:hypothetical protein
LKKPSDTPQQLEIHIFFLDRSLGKEKLADLLRARNFIIEVHDEHFRRDEEDEVWLEACGKRKWIAITPDTNILRDERKMRVIGEHKVRIFFLSSNNPASEVWAQAIISARREIETVLRKHRGPCMARITRMGNVWDAKELTPLGREKKKKKAG